TDSTITGNQVGDASGNPVGRGGGAGGVGTSFTSDTIAGNVAAQGGGLYNFFDTVQGSIIAGNRGGNCGPPGFARFAADNGYNIDDNAAEACVQTAVPATCSASILSSANWPTTAVRSRRWRSRARVPRTMPTPIVPAQTR